MKRLAIVLAVILALGALPSRVAAQQQPAADDKAAAEQPAAEEAERPGEPAEDGPDIDALRKEYMRLRDKLFRSRARAAAVGDALYTTKLTILLHWASGRFYSVNRATVRLDGANVYDDVQGSIAGDKAPRFEGFVAPGRHVISIRIEVEGKEDDRFASVMENTFAIQAPAGTAVIVDVTAKDDGDIPYKWAKKGKGSYKLRLDVMVTSKKRKGRKGRSDKLKRNARNSK